MPIWTPQEAREWARIGGMRRRDPARLKVKRSMTYSQDTMELLELAVKLRQVRGKKVAVSRVADEALRLGLSSIIYRETRPKEKKKKKRRRKSAESDLKEPALFRIEG